VIELTWDPCAPFAQRYVTYELADCPPLDQPCFKTVATFKSGAAKEQIYLVIPTG
jgi:hypothetical protein